MGIAKKLLLGLVFVAVIVILVLGYFGFVPIVSDIMGANAPRDLGITQSASALSSVNSKLGVSYGTLPASAIGAASLSESGSQQISVALTSEEVTALINDHASKWKYYPIENVQVKINTDNTVELSGVLHVDRWSGYADAIELAEGTRSQVRPYLSYVQTNPAIYMKGTITLGSYPQIGLMNTQIGRFDLPTDQANSYAGTLEYFAYEVSHKYQIQISSMYASGGMLYVSGNIPTYVGLAPSVEQQTPVRQTAFWAPSLENALEAFGLVTFVYVVGNFLRAQLNSIGEKLRGLLPSGIQMWIENYISSKSEVALRANKGSAFKLTKVELIAYVIALVTLTIAFTYSSAATIDEMIVVIPTILVTSILIEFLKNYILNVYARRRGAWSEYRIWPSGLLMFIVSSFVFKTPFSAPSKSAQAEGEAADKIGGSMAVASVVLVLLFGAGFYYMSTQGISDIGNIGLGMCLLAAFFDSIPVPPLNGKDIWDWNKNISIVLLVATFAANLYWLMFM